MNATTNTPPNPTPIRIALRGPDAFVRAGDAVPVAALLATRAPQHPAPLAPGATPDGFGWRINGRFTFPAKLAPCVAAALERKGHAVQLTPLPGRPVARWESVDPMLRRLIGAPEQAAFGGLIPVTAGVEPPSLVYYLLKLFPHVRAVVAAPHREVNRWRRYLAVPTVNRPVVASPNDKRLWNGRRAVLVVPLSDLDHCRAEDFDLAIVPDARPLARRPLAEVGPGWWRRTFPAPCEWRVTTFGFLPGGTEGLSDWNLLTLTSWFGGLLKPRDRDPLEHPDPLGWLPLPAPGPWPEKR